MSKKLPPDVISDILSRLPAKTLLRFKCVCKPWRSLINGPYFIKLHLNRSLNTNANLNLILIGSKVYLMELNSPNPVISQQLDPPLKGTQVLASCNGLLCICKSDAEYASDAEHALWNPYTREHHVEYAFWNPSTRKHYAEYALWNPSTRKHHVLPPIVAPYDINDAGRTYELVWGLGFDAINDDYKVVRIAQAVRNEDGVPLDAQVKVYSLRSDSWRNISKFEYFMSPVCTQGQGAYADGALHWVVFENSDDVENEVDKNELIVAFDLGVEEFHEVPQPEHRGQSAYMSLSVLVGCLCVSYYFRIGEVNDGFRCDVWVRKESWIKLFSIPKVRTIENVGLRPLAYSKSGEQVISEHCDKGLLWYDFKTKRSRLHKRIVGVKDFHAVDVCVGSLVPINPGRLNKEKQEREQKGRKKKTDDFLSVGFKLVL